MPSFSSHKSNKWFHPYRLSRNSSQGLGWFLLQIRRGMFANPDIDENERTTLIILHPYDFILIGQQAVSGIP